MNQTRHQNILFKTIGIIVILSFFSLFSLNIRAEDNNLGQQDYQDYLSSRYASTKWNQLVKTGMEAFHSESYDVSLNSLYKAFNQGCESPIVLFMMALLNEQKQSFYSALEYYNMAGQGFKKDNQSHRFYAQFDENYGRALYYSGKVNEAMPLLKKAGKNSQSYWLLKMLGMLAYERGDALEAVSYLERAIRVRTNDVTKEELIYVYGLLGKLFLYQGEKEGAMRYYQMALDLDPNNPAARQFMSDIERNNKDQQMHQLMDKLKDM